MRYLITHPDHKPFITHWFDPENNWIEGQIVYDLIECKYMAVRYTWEHTTIDSL
jgi:hypothetical protein